MHIDNYHSITVDAKTAKLWAELTNHDRFPTIQFGPTEPLGEYQWCVSLVNPATEDFFASSLYEAMTDAASPNAHTEATK